MISAISKMSAYVAMPLALAVFMVSCTPAQESQIITDIRNVVTFAGTVIQVVQTFGVLDTVQNQKDVQTALADVQKYTTAADAAVTEMNSADVWNTKVSKIAKLFLDAAPVGQILNAKLAAAVNMMTAAVQMLLSQLHPTTVTAKFTVSSVSRHELHKIQKQALQIRDQAIKLSSKVN